MERRAAKGPEAKRGNVPEEYFSVRHPDYRKAESRFAVVGINLSYYPHQPDYDALDRLEERLRDDREADSAVFDAIKMVGLMALDPPRVHELDPDDSSAGFVAQVEGISGLIWKRVERWYEDARYARTKEARAAAAKLLQRLGSTLAGSRKGMRAKIVTDRFAVWLYYRKTLFSILQATHLLEGLRCCMCPPSEKVKTVCGAYDIPEDWLWRHLNLDSEGRPYRLRVTPEETARILTAEHFRITQQTVENILSSGSSK